MPSLFELQAGFRDALFMGGGAEEAFLLCLLEAPRTGRQRLATYRRSVTGRLIDALEATYPVITALVGRPFLREAARQYALTHPSLSGDLNEYGEDFADFLAAYPHASDLPYLADVARLEWRVQAVASAPDEPAPTLESLAAMPAEDWADLVFVVSRCHARLDSPWPAVALWRAHQPGGDGLGAEDWEAAVCRALVRREGARLHVDALSPGEAALFDNLAAGEPLGQALFGAVAAEAGFDPTMAFRRFATWNLLLSARPAKKEAP